MLRLPQASTDLICNVIGLEDEEIAAAIEKIREELGDELMILGHHYQSNAIIQHADVTGDSFLLSQLAASSNILLR